MKTITRAGGSSPLTRGKPVFGVIPRQTRRLIPAHAGKTTRPSGGAHWPWAHPRSRGENPTAARPCAIKRGSSPLTRGKPARAALTCRSFGLIPAHAGKTLKPGGQGLATQAHPRSRGENRVSVRAEAHHAGSSPLTRGKRTECEICSVLAGLIPAHAGKTTLPTGRASPSWAHPRSRGENPRHLIHRERVLGSSPLTRGKPATVTAMAGALGLIPAHAGKTQRA